jgi:hypothetical protein
VPEGWGADLDRMGAGLGSVTSKVTQTPSPGFPRLVLTGRTAFGSLTVRHPTRFDRWRHRRWLKKQLKLQSQVKELPPGAAPLR